MSPELSGLDLPSLVALQAEVVQAIEQRLVQLGALSAYFPKEAEAHVRTLRAMLATLAPVLRESQGTVHVPTCLCERCERTGGGDFAIRAYFQGDDTALSRLSDAVARLLPSLRRKHSGRPEPAHEASRTSPTRSHEVSLTRGTFMTEDEVPATVHAQHQALEYTKGAA